ncbi:MAG: mechanosensitive ion channel family protein [Fibrobacteria bacterium]|nr:mechanosensitive ion channel family protein [Fibrobacteria bacterium]
MAGNNSSTLYSALTGSIGLNGDKTGGLLIDYSLRIIAAILILSIGYLAAKYISKKIEKIVLRREFSDASLAAISRKSIFTVLMAVVILMVLERFGVQTTSLIAVLGAAGLAVGLALQGTLSNIAAGVVLLVLRPFRSGNAVKIGGGEVYLIDEVGLFVTKAHQPDGPRVTIPNSKIWGDTIVNYSETVENRRRFDIAFGVSYGDDLNKTLEVLRNLAAGDSRVLEDPAPVVKIESLGDSSVNILFRVHTLASEWFDTKLDLTKAGKEALEAAGLTIPFPQQDVHIIGSDTQADGSPE